MFESLISQVKYFKKKLKKKAFDLTEGSEHINEIREIQETEEIVLSNSKTSKITLPKFPILNFKIIHLDSFFFPNFKIFPKRLSIM